MSATHMVVGSSVVAAAVVGVLGLVLPEPQPITVHSISYEDGIVSQDRTVVAEGEAFYASWAAAVMRAEDDTPIAWCNGSGSWPYPTGRRKAAIDLPEWVGSEECTPDSLPPGEYYLKAAWYWGNNQTSARSEPFAIP